MKGLYHYTSKVHLPFILNSGYLKLTRGILEDQVVWLTTSNESLGNGLEGSCVDKTEIRFILKDMHVISWKDYREKIIQGEDKELKQAWADDLEINQNPNAWYLFEYILPLELVAAIENTKTGKKIILDKNLFTDYTHRLKKKEIRNILSQLS